jgi:uncharacterized repeat protein (TIGR03803 family)
MSIRRLICARGDEQEVNPTGFGKERVMKNIRPLKTARLALSAMLSLVTIRFGALCLILAAIPMVSLSQDQPAPNNKVTFTNLINFDGTNGGNPASPLVQGLDGNLYGTTTGSGASGSGTFFKITPGGTLTTLYSFCSQPNCADGNQPTGSLTLGTDGDLYGITLFGGSTGGESPSKSRPAVR